MQHNSASSVCSQSPSKLGSRPTSLTPILALRSEESETKSGYHKEGKGSLRSTMRRRATLPSGSVVPLLRQSGRRSNCPRRTPSSAASHRPPAPWPDSQSRSCPAPGGPPTTPLCSWRSHLALAPHTHDRRHAPSREIHWGRHQGNKDWEANNLHTAILLDFSYSEGNLAMFILEKERLRE